MSAIAAILNNNIFAIATDTLGYKHFQDGSYERCKYTSKIQYFPEQQTCVASLGYARLKTDLYRFVYEEVSTNDIESLVECIWTGFLNFIDLSDYRFTNQPMMTEDQLGNLEFFGYSPSRKTIVYYRLEIDRSVINMFEESDFTGGTIIQHPKIDQESLSEILSNASDISKVLVEVMKVMYDNSRGETCNTPLLGGQIIIAILSINPNLSDSFQCVMFKAHEFEDYHPTLKKLQSKKLSNMENSRYGITEESPMQAKAILDDLHQWRDLNLQE